MTKEMTKVVFILLVIVFILATCNMQINMNVTVTSDVAPEEPVRLKFTWPERGQKLPFTKPRE